MMCWTSAGGGAGTVPDLVGLGRIIPWWGGLEASEAALITSWWRNSDWTTSEWNSTEVVASWHESASSLSSPLSWDISHVGSVLLGAGDMANADTAVVSVVSFLQLSKHRWDLLAQVVLVAC